MKEDYLLYDSIYMIFLKKKHHRVKEHGLEVRRGFDYKEIFFWMMELFYILIVTHWFIYYKYLTYTLAKICRTIH